MAIITSYTTLLTAVQSYLARSDLAGDAPGFVQLFESRFYRQPKNFGPWMEQALSGTIAAGVIAVPTDFLALKSAYLNTSPTVWLDRVSVEQMLSRYPRGGDSGRPLWIARERGSFIFGPQADGGYTVRGTYYAKPAALRDAAGDAASHWLILNAPDLCLYGALLEAEPFVKNDARLPVWNGLFAQALKDYRDLVIEDDLIGQEVLA